MMNRKKALKKERNVFRETGQLNDTTQKTSPPSPREKERKVLKNTTKESEKEGEREREGKLPTSCYFSLFI